MTLIVHLVTAIMHRVDTYTELSLVYTLFCAHARQVTIDACIPLDGDSL